IIGRPRPLPRQRRADHLYTLNCEEPVKATPAFNRELCARFGVSPIDFDGRSDALLHGFTGDGTQHMEYLCDRGAYDDLPLADILQALKSHYGSFIDQPNSSPDLFA
ncbi:hypothetical protein ACJH6H_25965, partial [Mycobacterium sp. SMC-21]